MAGVRRLVGKGERVLLDLERNAPLTCPVNCINEQLILAVRTVSTGVFCSHKWLRYLLQQVDGNNGPWEMKRYSNTQDFGKPIFYNFFFCNLRCIVPEAIWTLVIWRKFLKILVLPQFSNQFAAEGKNGVWKIKG